MLGERLATLRKQKKLTQEQIATRIHISRATYAQYEINRRVPEYLTLEKLADYFEVTIDYLVGREIKESPIEETKLEGYAKRMAEIVRMAKTEEQAKKLLDFAEEFFK